jgi:hypothetical protein
METATNDLGETLTTILRFVPSNDQIVQGVDLHLPSLYIQLTENLCAKQLSG